MYIKVRGSEIYDANSYEVGLNSEHRAVVFRGNDTEKLNQLVADTLKDKRLKEYNVFTTDINQSKEFGFRFIVEEWLRQELNRREALEENKEILVILNNYNEDIVGRVLNSKTDRRVYLIIIDKSNSCDLHNYVTEYIADTDHIWTQREDINFIIFQTQAEYKAVKNHSL